MSLCSSGDPASPRTGDVSTDAMAAQFRVVTRIAPTIAVAVIVGSQTTR
jgi:hypothetical protein